MTALPPQRSAMEVAPSGPTPPTSAHHIQAPPPVASNQPIDCYEDMFKEITRKLYGEEGLPDYQGAERALTSLVSADRTLTTIDYDAEGNAFKPEDHITAFGLAALMQNGFPPPGILNANFAPKLATNASSAAGSGAPANAEDKWSASEELLPWTTSRIASYNPAQKLFRCAECECVGFLGRVAEHWLGAHGALRPFQCPQCPYASAWSRCAKIHLTREHSVPDASADAVFKENPVLDEVTRFLQRLKGKVDAPGSTNRVISVTNAPATTATSANSVAVPTENSEGEGSANAAASVTKRYNCGFCPYATDRRDLYTRHENIHREEKPFQCYVCQKQFNRADHVKKHFLRMHREHPYDINRIRKQPSPAKSPVYSSYPKFGEATGQMSAFQTQPGTAAGANQQQPQRIQKVDNHKTEAKASPDKPGSKKKGEKRYACCYCSWAGVDNWCLKRHLNTHLKPFVCALCDYKAARSERLATHVLKVHNKKACGKCNFLAEDQAQLVIHQQEQHALDSRQPRSTNSAANNSPGHSGMLRSLGPLAPFQGGGGAGPNVGPLHNAPTTVTPFGSIVANVRPNLNESQQQHHQQQQQQQAQQQQQQWRPQKQGAERLFHYMEVSDSSDLDDQQYNTSRLQPVMQTISQDFHKAGGMQWTKNNNAYGISPGKRMRLDGNKENIVKTHRPYYEPLEKSSKPSARKSSLPAPTRPQGPEVTIKSPEVLNLKVKREADSEDDVVDSDNKMNLNAFAQFYKAQSDSLKMSTSSLDSGDDIMDVEIGAYQEYERIDGKRSRKQTQPRKVAHKTNTKITLASIRDEYLTKHITRKSINCSLCPETDYSYHTKLSLAMHMSLRHKNDIIACNYCCVDFEYDFLVKSHNKDCIKLHSAITNNNSASVSRPKNITDQRVPDF